MKFLKVFFRWVFPVSAALLLCMCCILPVSAEEDAAQEEEKQYKTIIHYNLVEGFGSQYTGGSQTLTVISSKPFYVFYSHSSEGSTFVNYFCGDLEDFYSYDGLSTLGDVSYLKNCSVSYLLVDNKGVATMSNTFGQNYLIYQGGLRSTVTVTCPIFDSAESLQRYLETGDDSGIVNKDDLQASVSKSLPYLRNVTWHVNPNCYGSSPKVVGDEFTWDTSELYPAAKIEVKADVTIHFGKTNDFLNIITGTGNVQLDIKNTVNVISYDGSTGLSSPSYDSGYLLIPDDKLRQAVAFYVDNNTDFASSAVQSVSVTSFYLRMVFYDETERVLHVGGWTRVNVQGYMEGGDFILTGDFDPDTGDYIQDTESDGSYSYGTNIDGSYDFDNTLGVPKDMGEAFEMFLQIMKLLFSYMGKVPELVKRVYGFLPSIFNWMIGALLFVAFILRILGR